MGEKVIFIYTGIDYGSFPTALDMVGAKRRDRQGIYLGLRLMEAAALNVLNADRDG